MALPKTFQTRILFAIAATTMISGCLKQTAPPNADNIINAGSTSQNTEPVISGLPDVAVLAGDAYSFKPVASDADGDPLTFLIQNKPRWATFDTLTGRLSGQALLGDIGVYSNIRISVSDGVAQASLSDFSVLVTASADGSITLEWTAPSENSDGSPLTDLAGFNIYFGKSINYYPNQIRIDNPSISIYVVENLLPGRYYVVATSFNTTGVESQFSNVAVKTVPVN